MISSITGGTSKTFVCNGMEGRYVNIVIPGRREYLTLCEVDVTGIESDDSGGRSGKTAPTGDLYHITCPIEDFEQIVTVNVQSNTLTGCS